VDTRLQQVLEGICVARRQRETRYDKFAVRYEATVLIAAIDEWR
jgi:hypothetical protein